jgi:hypothetical protein
MLIDPKDRGYTLGRDGDNRVVSIVLKENENPRRNQYLNYRFMDAVGDAIYQVGKLHGSFLVTYKYDRRPHTFAGEEQISFRNEFLEITSKRNSPNNSGNHWDLDINILVPDEQGGIKTLPIYQRSFVPSVSDIQMEYWVQRLTVVAVGLFNRVEELESLLVTKRELEKQATQNEYDRAAILLKDCDFGKVI